MSSRRREFDAVLLRADNFITKQMHKLEQKRARQEAGAGRSYGQIPSYHEQTYGSQSSPQHYQQEPPQGGLSTSTWIQEYDSQSQRWYYIDQATGRAQWEPPSFPERQQPRQQALGRTQRADTMGDEQLARRLQEEDSRARSRLQRPIQQPLDPTGGRSPQLLDVGRGSADARNNGVGGVSPHPSPHGRLPPGTHLDMRTGQIVTSMYPPDYPGNK